MVFFDYKKCIKILAQFLTHIWHMMRYEITQMSSDYKLKMVLKCGCHKKTIKIRTVID